MRRWLDPKWYGFLWQRKDRRGPVVVVVLLLLALAAGGYAAASSMNSNDRAVGIVRVEALKQKVRVHGRERVVTRYVTLATTDVARPSTVFQTRLVTRPVVKTVQAAPVVRRQIVHVTAKGSTVTRLHDSDASRDHHGTGADRHGHGRRAHRHVHEDGHAHYDCDRDVADDDEVSCPRSPRVVGEGSWASCAARS